uniref:Uncharacterized protein n=1 Tax=Chromera velia CCMP2878 TaxID=1169474 RepID=A0A0G4IC59_9ALVE|eukprot:Cvel_13054.t1-p1 / transcript=Cvel_13054.t1 / gene=Cvel_13054 / organism=Chromera_velia_CCMP2878 / gene_product=hypothetical protein / transcript_product=hypothetical protein / location=Cvel_scaffold878:44191-47210(+) / protein_length=844 / sequence_SO=supercontig / SO=protein_coding / is_pseudo=false
MSLLTCLILDVEGRRLGDSSRDGKKADDEVNLLSPTIPERNTEKGSEDKGRECEGEDPGSTSSAYGYAHGGFFGAAPLLFRLQRVVSALAASSIWDEIEWGPSSSSSSSFPSSSFSASVQPEAAPSVLPEGLLPENCLPSPSPSIIRSFENNPVVAACGHFVEKGLNERKAARRERERDEQQAPAERKRENENKQPVFTVRPVEWDVWVDTAGASCLKCDSEKARHLFDTLVVSHGSPLHLVKDQLLRIDQHRQLYRNAAKPQRASRFPSNRPCSSDDAPSQEMRNRRGGTEGKEQFRKHQSLLSSLLSLHTCTAPLWLRLYMRTLQCLRVQNVSEKDEEGEAHNEALHSRKKSFEDKDGIEECLDVSQVFREALQLESPQTVHIILDLKSRALSPSVVSCLLIPQIEKRGGVRVVAVGSFVADQLNSLSLSAQRLLVENKEEHRNIGKEEKQAGKERGDGPPPRPRRTPAVAVLFFHGVGDVQACLESFLSHSDCEVGKTSTQPEEGNGKKKGKFGFSSEWWSPFRPSLEDFHVNTETVRDFAFNGASLLRLVERKRDSMLGAGKGRGSREWCRREDELVCESASFHEGEWLFEGGVSGVHFLRLGLRERGRPANVGGGEQSNTYADGERERDRWPWVRCPCSSSGGCVSWGPSCDLIVEVDRRVTCELLRLKREARRLGWQIRFSVYVQEHTLHSLASAVLLAYAQVSSEGRELLDGGVHWGGLSGVIVHPSSSQSVRVRGNNAHRGLLEHISVLSMGGQELVGRPFSFKNRKGKDHVGASNRDEAEFYDESHVRVLVSGCSQGGWIGRVVAVCLSLAGFFSTLVKFLRLCSVGLGGLRCRS